MTDVTQIHEEKETLTVDVNIPGHEPRTTTALFSKSKAALKASQHPPRCWICGRTEAELGAPLEAHHNGVERSFAEGEIDWDRVKADFPHHDWSTFDPANPYTFVDDMSPTGQGLLLCKQHHTGRDSGIHNLAYPLWILQRYLKDGAQFSPTEVIHHDQV
ncbi:MAG TPA: hypothetical protein VF534_27490 [Paraburkholderia sp.]